MIVRTLVAFALVALCQQTLAQTFDDLSHRPDQFKGSQVTLTGKVVQSLQDGTSYTLRVNITQERYGWNDTILVAYKADTADERIVEGDIVDIRGRSGGIQSYKAIFGQTIQLPFVIACDVRTRKPGAAKFVSPSDKCAHDN